MPKHKTIGVQFSTIQYGCGCVSEMDKMKYCPLHGVAPDLLAETKEELRRMKTWANALASGKDYQDVLDGMLISIDKKKQLILKAAGSLCEQGERKQGRKS